RTLDCFRPKEVLDMNDMLNPNKMVEATHLTRAGRLTEATALLQRMLRDESGPDMTFGTAGDIVPRKRKPQTIDATAANDKTPRRPRFPRASTTLCIAAIAALGAESAAAQNCFLFFCQPGSQSQPSWQGTPTPEPDRQGEPGRPFFGGTDSPYSTVYAESNSEPFPVPALRLSDVDPTYLRKSVYYPTTEPPGTIVSARQSHFLYLVEGGGRAIRYGVGVGRTGFGWSGIATVHNKQEWPDWYPPKEMIERQPEIRRQMSELQSGVGMHGGPRNPLGA